MNWQGAVERTVTGLGYELVDAERSAGGLLRVYIDHPAGAAPGGSVAERFINVDDCEKVTRQLQHVLEVENCAYERLEVSSPGLDRPLKKAADYARFAGEQVELTLKLPFQGRKKFRGQLQPHADGWRLLLQEAAVKPALPRSRTAAAQAAQPAGLQRTLDFSLDEVREARLVPVVDFKGRRVAGDDGGAPGAAAPTAGPRPMDADGGRIQ